MAPQQTSRLKLVVPASSLPTADSNAAGWALPALAGRLVELSAAADAAHLTAAFSLVLEAQLSNDTAAWITLKHSSFFPPDAVDSGVDLNALPVLRVPNARMAGRAADHLVRSGGFGLVVLDLSSGPETESAQIQAGNMLPVPLLTRLLGQVRQQNMVLLFLTRKSSECASLHSLISLRAEANREKRGEQ